MPSALNQAVVERKQLVGDHGVPVIRYMLAIQALVALGITQVQWLASFKFEAVLFYGFLGSSVLWLVGLPMLVRRITGQAVVDRVRLETRKALQAWASKPLQVADYSTTLSKKKRVTGTGIAFDGEALYVIDQGEVVRVPTHDVVSWQWYVPDSFGSRRMDGLAQA